MFVSFSNSSDPNNSINSSDPNNSINSINSYLTAVTNDRDMHMDKVIKDWKKLRYVDWKLFIDDPTSASKICKFACFQNLYALIYVPFEY